MDSSKKFLLLVLILLPTLYSCGFQVIYKERDKEIEISYVEELATIRIQKDRSRMGQRLKNNLYEVLNPSGANIEPKYFLVLTQSSSSSPTYITTTGASGRSNATFNVKYELKSLKNGVVISVGDTTVSDNYDMTSNRYGTHKAGSYVEINLTKIAAQNIRNSIVNDFVELRRKCLEGKMEKDEVGVNLLLCEAL